MTSQLVAVSAPRGELMGAVRLRKKSHRPDMPMGGELVKSSSRGRASVSSVQDIRIEKSAYI